MLWNKHVYILFCRFSKIILPFISTAKDGWFFWQRKYKLINFKDHSNIDNKFDKYKVICKGEHLTPGIYSEGLLGIENTRTKQQFVIVNSTAYIIKFLEQLEFDF